MSVANHSDFRMLTLARAGVGGSSSSAGSRHPGDLGKSDDDEFRFLRSLVAFEGLHQFQPLVLEQEDAGCTQGAAN